MRRPIPARLTLVIALSLSIASSVSGEETDDGSRGGWSDRCPIEDLEPIEIQARSTRSCAAAESLYMELYRRRSDSNATLRAALWLGRYYYGRDQQTEALRFFEAALHAAGRPGQDAEARFWCDQVRRRSGRDLLPAEPGEEEAGSFWTTLDELVRVDVVLHQARRQESESQLLSIEGDLRRHGLRGLEAARWIDCLSLPGPARVTQEDLALLLSRTRALPEQAGFEETENAYEFVVPSWTLQLGTFQGGSEARRLADDLSRLGLDVRVDRSSELGRDWHRVRVGEASSRAEIDSLASAIAQAVSVPFRVVQTQ